MCGIAGFICGGGKRDEFLDTARRMVGVIRHRGPDGDGYWLADDGSVVFGHVRLAIQDLTEHGAQPMHSESGRYVISYNGEVYNFPELMKELQTRGHVFRGHSDTEVILAAIEEWGLENAVSRFIGMFALAIWDKESNELSLVRDRLGIKPLYYRDSGKSLVFGSELKSICEFDAVKPNTSRGALALFLRHSYVPAPYTIYDDVRKLQPGSILTARMDDVGRISSRIDSYWSIERAAGDAANHFQGDYGTAVEQLHALLSEAVSARMTADVPLGAFLSGGIDSSTIVSLMQRQSSQPVRTFTIGLGEESHNESHWAKKVATHLGTEHRELYLQPADVLSIVPEIASIYDEPFSDSSQIPTILISRLAREDVTVSLSGDGGDELFAGYKRYDAAAATWRSIKWLPGPLRNGVASVLSPMSSVMSRIADPVFGKIYDSFGVAGNRGGELQRAATVLRRRNREDLYRYMMSHWKDGAAAVRGISEEPSTLLESPPEWMTRRSFRDYMMLADTCTYLPDDILTKVDRASMSCSLEARVPLLDHRVVEFAIGLPVDYKRRGGVPKSPLRDVLRNYLPAELIERPKMGFAIPIDDWLRGPLKEWAADLISADTIKRQGYLHAEPISQKWDEHQSGSRNWAGYLWDVLMFQAWLETVG